jgi:hypothetical protein
MDTSSFTFCLSSDFRQRTNLAAWKPSRGLDVMIVKIFFKYFFALKKEQKRTKKLMVPQSLITYA